MSKKNNILDSVDMDKGPRMCPECGYQFPLLLFVKRYVMKFGFPKWTCPNCQEYIKYNYTKANLVGLVIFIVSVILFVGLQSKLKWDLPILALLVPYFFFTLVFLNFDTIGKYKE